MSELQISSGPPIPGHGARASALAILSGVLRKRRPLDAAMEEVLGKQKLEARDAGFARVIVYETLRRFGQLQALIAAFVPKSPPPHKAGPTLEILYMGAAELLFLNVPAHAAVDGANRLAASDDKAVHFKPLINAVLRRVSREGAELIAKQDAAKLNTPDWLWPRWISAYGEEGARAIATAHLKPAPLDLSLKAETSTAFDLAEMLAPYRLRVRDAGRVDALEGYGEGEWWVQDFAASLPARLLGDVKGKRALDLCAAPGGKTAQLAALGASVTAVDLSPERLSRVKENLARLKLSAELVAADARGFEAEAFDAVLLDAPCTATGTIRRHPDLVWIKSAADIGALLTLQAELFDVAADLTAPGGTLVYAVCSLEPEEGAHQVEDFLSRNRAFARVPLTKDDVFDAAFITPEGDLRTLPSHWADKGGMDGFYAAKLVRRL